MANRIAILKLLRNPIAIRPLLMAENNTIVMRAQPKTTMKQQNPTFNSPSMFSPQIIKKYWELSPLFIIVGAGLVGLVYAIIRNGLTRDDVRFGKSIPMNCEKFDEQPKSRKFLTYNQTYKAPKGLAEALKALEEPTKE